jgi:hypothetical protein
LDALCDFVGLFALTNWRCSFLSVGRLSLVISSSFWVGGVGGMDGRRVGSCGCTVRAVIEGRSDHDSAKKQRHTALCFLATR